MLNHVFGSDVQPCLFALLYTLAKREGRCKFCDSSTWRMLLTAGQHVYLLSVVQEAEAAQKQFVQLRREHEALQNSVRSQVGPLPRQQHS